MENYEIGFFLYYVLTGIFIYLCAKQIIDNDKKNNRNR
jgi:hypothetical protein